MWRKSKPYWLVTPAVTVIILLFFGGLALGLAQSLGYFPAASQFSFSIDAYERLINSADFWRSLLLTLRTALLSTLVAGILGVFGPLIFLIIDNQRSAKRKDRLTRIFQFPLLLPHFVSAYLMVLLFMQSGWLSRLLHALGLIDKITDFPVLINDSFGWGIILTYAWKEAPFVALMLYPVLRRAYSEWRDVARVFGANNWRFIWDIIVPLLAPAWASANFIVFAFTFSAFEVPFLLGVTYPKMLPVLAYDLYTSGGLGSMPEALAINAFLAGLTALFGVIAYKIRRHWSFGKEGGR